MSRADDLAEVMHALSAPLGDIIAAVGRGVAEAQQSLDLHTLETFRVVHNSDDQEYQDFRALGYQPTWYRIPEVTADISVALSVSGRDLGQVVQSGSGPVQGLTTAPQTRVQLRATPVDASFANAYEYDVRASSRLSFKVVAVPAAAEAEGLRVVPKLTGLTVRDARSLLAKTGISSRHDDPFYEPQDQDRIIGTDPEAGVLLTGGQSVVIRTEAQSLQTRPLP